MPFVTEINEVVRVSVAHSETLVGVWLGDLHLAYPGAAASDHDLFVDEDGDSHAAALPGINQASGSHFAFIPGGGLFPAALGDLLADVSNRYVGIHFASPAANHLERSLVRWIAGLVGYPDTAGGDLTSTCQVIVEERGRGDPAGR